MADATDETNNAVTLVQAGYNRTMFIQIKATTENINLFEQAGSEPVPPPTTGQLYPRGVNTQESSS